jgi:hypothetical protein
LRGRFLSGRILISERLEKLSPLRARLWRPRG